MTTVRRGLDSQGYIERDGSLGRVQDAFRPVVAAARDQVADVFGKRLDSAYLYGSVPRGTARVHRSDLDLLLVLREEPGDGDRADARAVSAAVDKEFAEVDGVGILLLSRARVLSDHETYDHGWFLACLCTPLLGEDLAEFLPRYRPDSRLARGTNGDLAALLPSWRERLDSAAAAGDDAALRALCRTVSRRVVRTGFTLVMPRWNGWTGELDEMAEVFGRYCPEWADRMRAAAALAYEPVADPGAVRELTDVLGPWLAREYTARHGARTPGPSDTP
ncbi:nucleotidyltransferase domain-containing protein [Streptomyces spectabilis]|uniref:Nucleotidyltransferase domain-containing protein n=1 Tax=Streptomyces spectabilis TaxID=68270 RepID=A0A5P2XDI9_STRST|nr:nucleotidyltransferase domain-containing protein [Streptomyces spectabilis]MBB5103630.1 putative nucleotidyltransferase [Streptomyces spectabilis]MCI3904125.1 nucleotidyltransferase domain-containing protein [Streptomyces spectabilis]QEV61255.1 nucleotidyltransferase domain-containing protein [Streptomyces spectabilis]